MTDETILTNLYSVQKLLKTLYTIIVNVNLKLTSPSLVSQPLRIIIQPYYGVQQVCHFYFLYSGIFLLFCQNEIT